MRLRFLALWFLSVFLALPVLAQQVVIPAIDTVSPRNGRNPASATILARTPGEGRDFIRSGQGADFGTPNGIVQQDGWSFVQRAQMENPFPASFGNLQGGSGWTLIHSPFFSPCHPDEFFVQADGCLLTLEWHTTFTTTQVGRVQTSVELIFFPDLFGEGIMFPRTFTSSVLVDTECGPGPPQQTVIVVGDSHTSETADITVQLGGFETGTTTAVIASGVECKITATSTMDVRTDGVSLNFAGIQVSQGHPGP